MTSKTLYSVTVDGELFTRRSPRTYTHAVVVMSRNRPEGDKATVWHWAGREDLARSYAVSYQNRGYKAWIVPNGGTLDTTKEAEVG